MLVALISAVCHDACPKKDCTRQGKLCAYMGQGELNKARCLHPCKLVLSQAGGGCSSCGSLCQSKLQDLVAYDTHAHISTILGMSESVGGKALQKLENFKRQQPHRPPSCPMGSSRRVMFGPET
eukprot:1159958-Pelagomonas_calceolata.AAC.7